MTPRLRQSAGRATPAKFRTRITSADMNAFNDEWWDMTQENVTERFERQPLHERSSKQQGRELAKVAVSGWLGTALEYVDFQLYGLAAAMVFNKLFFPEVSPAVGLIASMATYGTGYVARLVGAWYFGRMGDRIGRKTAVVLTIAIMGTASTLIGFLPTYAQIGIFAPILLMVLRLVQGFGAGAEISGSTVLITEFSPRNWRGVLSSLVALGTNSGTLLATAIWLLVVGLTNEQQLLAWGWRVPFVCSFLILFVAYVIRKHISETPVFENRSDVVDGRAVSRERLEQIAQHDDDVAASLKIRKGKAFLVAALLRFGQTGNSTIIQTFLVGYVTSTLLVAKTLSTSALLWGSILGFATVPLIAWVSDRLGRRPLYIVNSVVAMVAPWPLIWLISSGETWKLMLGYILVLNMAVLNLFALENVTMAELFGSRARYTQLALSKEVGGVAATAIGPVLAATLTVALGSWWPIAALISAFSIVTLIGSLTMPEVAGRDMEDLKDAI